MTNHDPQLSSVQHWLLSTFLAQAGEEAIGKHFHITRHGNKVNVKLGQVDIALADNELVALARLGYLQVFTDQPQSVVFTESVLKLREVTPEVKAPPAESTVSPASQVLRVDIVQVYAWLAACLVAALFSLVLLWLTVREIFDQNLTTSMASGVMTLLSSLLSAVFFKNYDAANERLKYLRSKPEGGAGQEKDP
jgi:hypothetical protein